MSEHRTRHSWKQARRNGQQTEGVRTIGGRPVPKPEPTAAVEERQPSSRTVVTRTLAERIAGGMVPLRDQPATTRKLMGTSRHHREPSPLMRAFG